jgi:5,10-methylenetetrahydromethanopterin reductase
MERNLQIGLNLLPDISARATAEQVRLAEDLGFDFVGITDGQMIWRDVYVALTLAAAVTKRIRLGPWVTNPVTRHPTVTVNAICSLDEVSEGRAFLGIGNGDDSVRTIGGDHAKLAVVADSVGLMYRLARGERVETEHGTWSLASAQGRLTVYWAASGGKSIERGAQHADGVIVSAWLGPDLFEIIKGHIRTGAERAGRIESDVETIIHTAVAVDEDQERALRAVRPYVARGLCYVSSLWLPDWSEDDLREFRKKYDYYHHFRADHDLATLVPERFVRRKAVVGTPGECIETLRMIRDHGFRTISMMPIGDVAKTMHLLSAKVLPNL